MRRALTDLPLIDRPLIDRIRRAARQEQFLDVVSAEEATRRFRSAISLAPLGEETVGRSVILALARAGTPTELSVTVGSGSGPDPKWRPRSTLC